MEGAAGGKGLAVFHFVFPVGKGEHGGVAGGGEVFFVEGLHGHDDDVEFVGVAVVVVVLVVVVAMVVFSVSMIVCVFCVIVMAAMADNELVRTGGQWVGSGPFKGVGGVEEGGVEFGGAAEVEAADVEHGVEGDVGILRAQDFCGGIHFSDTGFEVVEVGGGDEIGFVEDEDVGKRDLLLGFGGVAQVQEDVFGVDDGDDAVDAEVGAHFVVGEKGLGDGAGIGEAGGLDEDAVEAVFAFHQATEDADEVAAHAATDAAVVHFEEFFVALDDELVVHADFAKFILDYGEFFAVLLSEDAIKEGGFAGAEEAGENGDRDGSVEWHGVQKVGGCVKG